MDTLQQWKDWTQVIAQVATVVTMFVITLSALYAGKSLMNTRSQRKAEILREFWANLYRDTDARKVFLKISSGDHLNLHDIQVRGGLAHLLDALSTIGVIAQDDKAVRDLANLTSIAYVTVKTYNHPDVQTYLGQVHAEHSLMHLSDRAFGDFEALAQYLESDEARALRLKSSGELVRRRPYLLRPD